MNDLISLIKLADPKNEVIQMTANDFKKCSSGCRIRTKVLIEGNNIPILSSIREIEFRKGTRSLFYKENLIDESFKQSNFLKKKFVPIIPESINVDLGINSNKLKKIKKELLPLMPPIKRLFWNELPTNDNARDLCTFSET